MPQGGKKFVFPEGAQHGIESSASVSFAASKHSARHTRQ